MVPVTTKNGMIVSMKRLLPIQDHKEKLFFAQNRLCITNYNNEELRSIDLQNFLYPEDSAVYPTMSAAADETGAIQ